MSRLELPRSSSEKASHEFKKRRIELEKQIQALRASQRALDEARQRYLDFCAFVPAGNITPTGAGPITAINHTGALMLGMEPPVPQAYLDKLVQERTADLSQALKAAQLAGKDKDAFLANVSHEMRTPLSAIVELTALALRHDENPRQRDYLQKIGKAGKHLSRIINDLLDLSKVVAGHMKFEAIPFSLRALLQHAHDVMKHKAESKGLVLTQRISDDVPDTLIGDSLRLEQILLNLVGNAIKFTCAGKVEVRIGLDTREEKRVCITMDVEDTGIGMRPEDVAGLFQPFAQGDASISRKYGGTGLGLALSQRLATMMDGRISVSSREGSGSIFSLTAWLGVGDALDLPDAENGSCHAPAPVRYRNANVLIVEDQAISTEIVAELLSSVGITPHTANNGQEAVDTLAELGPTAFDLILMDIQMPVMDGLTAARQIRAWAGFDKLPIVAMTAQAMEHEKQISTAAGMSDHLNKPFDIDCFYQLLAKWMPDSHKVEPDSSVAPATVPAVPGLQALRGIDIDGALNRFGGKEDRYRHWLALFVEQSPAIALDIRQALTAGQFEQATRAAHAFKGKVGMLGLSRLHATVTALEAALIEKQPGEPLLERMERITEDTRKEIKAALGL